MRGNFFWYDLMTTDTVAAEKFYRDVVGWGAQDSGSPGYSAFTIQDRSIAGLMALPEESCKAGTPPCWTGYIYVDDVDAMSARIAEEGGKILRAGIEVPGVIRFAIVADPQGAVFIIANPLIKDAPSPLPQDTPGVIGWHELYAGEWKAAFVFYEKLFGWGKADAFDMGTMGVYQLFTDGSSRVIGGMMTKMPDMPAPFWTYYFNVESIDAAAKRVTTGGGKLLMEPHQVPTGQWIVPCTDPQGAHFALLAPQR